MIGKKPRAFASMVMAWVLLISLVVLYNDPAAGAAPPGESTTFGGAPAAWPGAFEAYTDAQGNVLYDPANESGVSPDDTDFFSGAMKGSGNRPSFYISSAADAGGKSHLVFRMRLIADPRDKNGGFLSTVWMVQLWKNGSKVAAVGLNGKPAKEDYIYISNGDGSVVRPIYKTDGTRTNVPGARVVEETGTGDYLLDIQVPLEQLQAIDPSIADGALRLKFVTSKAANLSVENKDVMDGDGAGVSLSPFAINPLPTIAFTSILPGTTTISGVTTHVEPNAPVTVAISGPESPLAPLVQADGTWSATLAQMPPDGVYTIRASVTNGNGDSAAIEETIDISSRISIDVPSMEEPRLFTFPAEISGSYARMKGPKQWVNFKILDGNGQTTLHEEAKLSMEPWKASGYASKVGVGAAIAPGNKYIITAAEQDNKVISQTAVARKTLQYLPSMITIVEPGATTDGTPTPTVKGTAAPSVRVQLLIDGQPYREVRSDEAGNWSIDVDDALAGRAVSDPPYVFTAKMYDDASESKTSAPLNYGVVDVDISIENEDDTITVTTAEPTVRGRTTDAAVNVTVTGEGQSYSVPAVVTNGKWSVALTGEYALEEGGTYTVTANTVTDVSEPATTTYAVKTSTNVDIENPAVLADVDDPITGTVEAGADLFVTVNGKVPDSSLLIHDSVTGTWSIAPSVGGWDNGDYTVVAVASDAAGNMAEDVASFTIAQASAPTASGVTVSGTAQVGSQLTGMYEYADANGDEESGTTYRWLRYDAALGGTGVAIDGETSLTYTLTQADAGKYIGFEVTPKNAIAPTTGTAVEGANRPGPITEPTTPPVTAVGSVDGAGTVMVSGASPNAALTLYDKQGVQVAAGAADAEGRYTFAGVAFGAEYAATQTLNGVESAFSNKVVVGPGTVVAVGSSGGEGTVELTGAVYGAAVTLYDKLGNVVGSGIADGTGSYTFQGVLTGTDYAATQTVDGIESAVSNKVSVGTGLITITGSRNGAGTITVTEAVYGAVLTLYDKNGAVTATGIANLGGTYTFVGVPAGTDYTATQTVDGLESGRSSKADVGPGPVAAVGSAKGEGTVTVSGGKPNAALKLYDKDGRLAATGVADGNGAFVFAGIPAGTDYSVTQTAGGLESEPSAKVRVGDDVADALKQVKVRFSQGDIWESVTLPVFLIADGAYETVVGWKSNKPAVISIEPEAAMQGGEVPEYKTSVNRQAEDVNVILTAIVEKDGRRLERTFLLIVKSNRLEEEKVTTPATNAVKVGETMVDQGVRVTRTTLTTNGAPAQTVDKLVMSDEAMQAIVNTVAGDIRIDFDDKPNASSDARADEIAVEIANAALQVIERNGGARVLNVTTPEGAIQLQPNSIAQLTEAGIDLFFRIVPIRDAREKQVVANRTAQTMQAEAGSGKAAEVLGIPREIVTNYVGYETEVIFPLTGLGITSEQIDSIRLLIEHDDEIRIVKVGNGPLDGTIVTDDRNVPVGFKFKLHKFSTFTFFRVTDAPTSTTPADTVHSDDVPVQEASITPPRENEIVTDREVTLEGKATPNAQVDVYLNGRKVGTVKSDANGTWTFFAGELAEGEYEVQTAIAGSGAKSQAYKFVVARAFVHYKYINGYPDGEFKSENSITRAEMAMMLARILQRSEVFAASPGIGAASYPDMPTSHWAFGAIERMKETGIMKGYENGEFRPDKRITRAEMGATLLRFLNLEPLAGTTSVYSDLKGHWAIDHIETLRQNGIMNGYPEGNFYPNRDLTRAEAVTMINRAVGRGPLLGNYASLWPDVSKTNWAYADVGEASKSHEAIWTQDGKEQWIRFVEEE